MIASDSTFNLIFKSQFYNHVIFFIICIFYNYNVKYEQDSDQWRKMNNIAIPLDTVYFIGINVISLLIINCNK